MLRFWYFIFEPITGLLILLFCDIIYLKQSDKTHETDFPVDSDIFFKRMKISFRIIAVDFI